jgi:hypothetical protein
MKYQRALMIALAALAGCDSSVQDARRSFGAIMHSCKSESMIVDRTEDGGKITLTITCVRESK